MSETIKPGIFEGNVVDYGIGKTKNKDPQAMVRFEFMDGENDKHNITWYGSFKAGQASEITCEALAVCGMTSSNPADLAKGKGSGVLQEDLCISLTLKVNDYNGKTSIQVAYINPPGGGGFRDVMEHGEAVQAFAGLNLGGIMAAANKKHGPKDTPPVRNFAPGAEPPMPTNQDDWG